MLAKIGRRTNRGDKTRRKINKSNSEIKSEDRKGSGKEQPDSVRARDGRKTAGVGEARGTNTCPRHRQLSGRLDPEIYVGH